MSKSLMGIDWVRLEKLCRIMHKVRFVESGLPSPCWIYPSQDRGQVRMGKEKRVYVHRMVYELWYSEKLSHRELIRHLCWNGQCVNPEHITRGTNSENMKDRKFPPVLVMIERLKELGYKIEK